MVTVTGDFARLRRIIEAFETMGGGLFGNSWLGGVRALFANRVKQLIGESFSQRRSPYGLPWKPSKRPGAGDLIESGKLRGSLVIKATREGVLVSSAVLYASVHQEGSKTAKGTIPARPFVPNREVWPSSWAKSLENEALFAIDDLWKRV
jgi:hypothetical protein